MEEKELYDLLKKIYEDHGVDFGSYRLNYVKRRIDARLRATSSAGYEEYIDLISKNSDEYENLLSSLTINITEFFRDKEVWKFISEKIVPDVYSKHALNKKENSKKKIKIWSAGCADGSEAYSLAILWNEFVETIGVDNPVSIIATDIDKGCLDKSKHGIYSKKTHLKNISNDFLDKYFSKVDEDKFTISDKLKERVKFTYHDMSKSGFESDFDMILCRNVMIFFSRELQEKVLYSLADSLKTGGYLVLGKVESIWGNLQDKFEVVDINNKVFRKK